MTADLFWDVAWRVGLPFVLVCLGLWAILLGKVVTEAAYNAMVAEKDRQILREQERSAELWALVRPSIGLARGAVKKLEEERGAGGRVRR